MRLCSIASGSSGNCIYVGSDATHLLMDVGISCKRTKEGVESLGLSMRDIDGIFITHEHSDHVAGLEIIAKQYEIPIYCTEGTKDAILNGKMKNKPDEALFHVVKPDEKCTVKDMIVHPLRISHDAADPVAYRIYHDKKKVGIITDLGYYTDYTVESLRGMDALLLEANHDVNMLQVGPYPYYLKQRILGKRGHLSNETAGKLLSELMHEHMQSVVLGHLSKENNYPELAYEAVRLEVTMADIPFSGNDIPIQVAKRSEPSPVIEIH